MTAPVTSIVNDIDFNLDRKLSVRKYVIDLINPFRIFGQETTQYSETLFKVLVETMLVTYVENGGYLDETHGTIFEDEVKGLEENNKFGIRNPYDFTTVHGEYILTILTTIRNVIPSKDLKMSLPFGWVVNKNTFRLYIYVHNNIYNAILGESDE